MLTIIIEIKSMKKSPKQNWESNIRRTPIILGLSAALCMPSAFSYANASDPVAGELVQSVQQGRTVTGKIIDDTGEPLIGVSVLVKGTTVGTITDFDGNYSLEVPSGKHILVISYIGYKTQDITVGKSNQLNIKMEADTQALDEVVVVDLEKFEHAITKYGTPLYVFDIDEVKRKTDYFRDSLCG